MNVTMVAGAPADGTVPAAVFDCAAAALGGYGHAVHTVPVRELPTVALLTARDTDPALARALRAVREADALVVAGYVHRAGYSGLVQSVLELLPKHALGGKPVLPIAVGGTQGRVVALDYALRPLLHARGATRIRPGVFVDEHAALTAAGEVREEVVAMLRAATANLDGRNRSRVSA